MYLLICLPDAVSSKLRTQERNLLIVLHGFGGRKVRCKSRWANRILPKKDFNVLNNQQDEKKVTCGDERCWTYGRACFFFLNFSVSTDAKDMMHFAGTLLQLTSKVLIAHDSVSDPQCSAGPWVQLMVSRNELNNDTWRFWQIQHVHFKDIWC